MFLTTARLIRIAKAHAHSTLLSAAKINLPVLRTTINTTTEIRNLNHKTDYTHKSLTEKIVINETGYFIIIVSMIFSIPLRIIGSWNFPKTNGQSIPSVNGDNGHC